MSIALDGAPELSYAVYALYSLLTLTVLLGCILLVRKILARKASFEGDMEFDHERIARELDQEIRDLENLRNRIFPTGHFTKAALQVQTANESKPAVTAAPAPVAAGTDPRVAELQEKVKTLTEALRQTEEKLASAPAAAPAASSGISSEEKAALEKSRKDVEVKLSQQTEELQKIKANAEQLERIVSEYQLFEEDFALVKKYRKENEVLRAELAKKGMSEEEIRKLLEANDALSPAAAGNRAPIAAVHTASEKTPEPSMDEVLAATTVEGEASPAASVDVAPPAPTQEEVAAALSADPQKDADAVFEAAQSQGQSEEKKVIPADAAEAVEKTVIAATPAAAPATPAAAPATPAPAQSEAEMEAMAESAVSEDELMAEFEKLLNEKDQST
jgi:hypothetical protein